ncbi:Nonribosomal peptide synthetase [Lachnellula suecica]|uniref:Nonribosomal peptide synthetase n=1 Tax=Lachnellula suecica TaxID=602035 RepID=A0A8T9CLA3_9HELO|nr:Nonribosomal peptide synthetase [Lachnellula suecica]
MDSNAYQSPRNWPVGTIYGFCRDRSLDITIPINAAWAIALWEYTDEEILAFLTQNLVFDSQTWYRCDAVVNTNSTFSSVLTGVKESTRQRQAGRLASAFDHVMDLLLSETEMTLSSVDLVSDHDKAELWTWNSTQIPETVNSCVHTLYERRVAQQPDELAVDAWDGSFTYKELDRISTLVAHHLVAQGVVPESSVPLCFDKSRWAVAAMMGVLKAGGAMAFIDPANPASRRTEIISQLRNDYVLTDASNAASWESIGIRPIIIDNNLIDCLPELGASPRTGVTSETLLYIIFTSGTTSKPKGCEITHKAFLSAAVQHAVKSNLDSRSRVMQLASYSFDVSVLEILTSLISGACVCTPDSAAMTQGLANIIDSYQITWAFLTPSLVKLIEPDQVPSLQTLALGGEKLSRGDIEKWAGHLQLINGYGPSECSVAAFGDPHLTPESDPANIGRSVGGLAWIVQTGNHHKLVPIGAVGELLISGPILARGYLSNQEMTAKAFIENPLWTESFPKGAAYAKHFYKTGDLAKFNSDGTIQFIGRKDTQVKVRGMRIELGEIEHSVSQHQYVKHVVVSFPKDGVCKDKLVAVLSLRELSDESPASLNSIQVVTDMNAIAQRDAVRNSLSQLLPEYMVPTVWVILKHLPLLASSKLNRKRIQEWLLDLSHDIYHDLIGISSTQETQSRTLSTQNKLRNIIGRVLNMPPDLIPPAKSFLGLGGDSITAMQVMAQCRNNGITVTAKDILRCKSIEELVSRARQVVESAVTKEETFDNSFQLSPIQRMYANKLRPEHEELPEVHFNQSFYIRLGEFVPRTDIKGGIDAIVSRHSMLRARFTSDVVSGSWSQSVLSGVEGSYRFKYHCLRSLEDAGSIATIAQRTLGLAGPIFSVDVFELEKVQYLFMVAHHAVIDWVSWRIILRDLETFISTGALSHEAPLPFQNWINLQAENSARNGDPNHVLPFEVPAPDFEFWDMEGKSNTWADTTSITFNLSQTLTSQLLGGEPHRAMRTEILDFLLASLFYSFGQVFIDRPLPAIFREGHGREPWDSSLDLSDTVGWFTTMYPFAINPNSTDDMVDCLKRVKDTRHSVPDNGRPYFASRFENEKAAHKFQDHDMIEIAFDYLGQFQSLDRPDAIVRQETRPSFLQQSDDVGRNLDRLSLIEITAEVLEGRMQYTFVYNRNMKHQHRIQEWATAAEHVLSEMVAHMLTAPLDFTLADFPLLSLSYGGLDKLLRETLPSTSFDGLENIEEVYSCSPMQNGLLFSQNLSKDAVYEYRHRIEVTSNNINNPIDAEHFANSWVRVVQRHSSLRTIFVESSSQDGLFDQVELKSITPDITMTTTREEDLNEMFDSQQPISYRDPKPPHRLTIARVAPNKLICQLEINHAIVDGNSIANIVHDLCQAYEGSLAAQPAFRFRDYIEYIHQSDTSVSEKFWKQYLQDQAPCMFPDLARFERPRVERSVGNLAVDIDISPETLKTFCEKLNITPLSLFQVAWGIVLKSYTESTRVCFGYLSAGRDVALPGVDGGVGPFLAMLVCSLDLSGGKLSEKLQGAADDLMKCLPNQYCGLASIQHYLGMGNTPLFNTILSFHRDDHISEMKSSEIGVKSLDCEDPTEYALGADIGLFQDTLEVSMQFWSDHITKEQASNVGSTLNKVLSIIIGEPNSELATLELASQSHIDKMIKFNGDNRPLPTSNRLLFAGVEENARKQPEAEAICSWDGTWTYKDLDDVTNRLGHYLHSVGVGPEKIVPYVFNKSAWATITMISILKAGGAVVGLDPTHPRHQLQKLVAEVNAAVVCASIETMDAIKGITGVKKLVVVGPEFVSGLPQKVGQPCPEVRPYNLACVVFSSGTTSKPKTIALEHLAMSTMTDLLGPPFKIDRDSRVFQFSAYTYDTSNHDIFVTLQRGGCVCIPSEDERKNNPASAMRRMNVSSAALTPTVARLLKPSDVPSLKTMSSGGEPMDRGLLETWVGAVDFFNGYGPAETAVTTSVSAPLAVDSSPSNIGFSYGARAWIVDIENFNLLVPLGVAGELLLEGPQLARSYLNNSELTARSFIHNPPWAQSMTPGLERRFYRTGDICRFNTDGTLSIMGRRDTMIKMHGQRVELDGIKHQIQSHLGKKAGVLVDALSLQNTSKVLTLIAFLCYENLALESIDTKHGVAIAADDAMLLEHIALQNVLKARLPGFMVPSMFIPIAEIPRTRNGKFDRKRLHEEVLSLSEGQITQYSLQNVGKRLPATPSEINLQALWSEVLVRPTKSFSLDDDFFRAGGDSLGAMKLVAAARARNLAITVSDIFKHPQLSDMALSLRSETIQPPPSTSKAFDLIPNVDAGILEEVKAEAAEQCGVPSQDIVDLYPCTALQEGLMALSNRLGHGAYKAQKVFRISSNNFDIASFKAAWASVATSEPILRTRIINTKAAGTLQVVLNALLEWYEVQEDLHSYLRQDLESPVGYGGALLRFALVNDADTCYFVWSAHHAVYDGVSANITLNQVRQILTGVEIQPTPVPFKEFIRHLSHIDSAVQDEFWKSQYPESNAPPLSFPSTPVGYQPNSHDTLKHTFSNRVRCTDGLNITTPSILRAAWAIVVSKYIGHKDVIFAGTLSGRTSDVTGISSINGPTITTVPIRIDLDLPNEATVHQYLTKIQDQATNMLPFEQTGLQHIGRKSISARAAVDNIANLLVIQPQSKADRTFQGLESVPMSQQEFDTYPLILLCSIGEEDTTTLEVHFDGSIISKRQMQRMLRHFDFTLRQLCNKPHSRLCDVDVINPDDENEILRWNGDLPETAKACIHHAVGARTNERPGASAVCAWDGNFTYSELNSISDRLAAHLQAIGVGPEAKVGLCLEKSKWNIVAMLSVLKASGAYMHMNPSNPKKLTKGLLDDLGATTIICSSSQAPILMGVVPNILVLDWDSINRLPPPQPVRSHSSPDNAAFIVHTSGSTGKPKAVVVDHQGFCSMAQYQAPRLGIGRTTRTLQFAAHWFDISNGDVFLTLMRGGCVCIPSEEERLNYLSGAINKYQVNWATMVPTAAAILQPADVPTLKHLSLGGEPIPADLHLRWSRQVILMNSYGPAECSVLTTMGSLAPNVAPQNIGVGLGCRTWITDKDDHNKLVSIGCIGELCVEGPIVTKGYLNNDSITASSYITNPEFAKRLSPPNIRIYKTGDLVRYESDGTLFIFGRKDNQIKIHGRRIECGEVEHQIVASGFPAASIVVDRVPEGGDETKPMLTAFVNLGSNDDKTHQKDELAVELSPDDKGRLLDLRHTLCGILPPHMIPTHFVTLQHMPLTQTGKKDRKRLRTLGMELNHIQLEEYRLYESVHGDTSSPTHYTVQEAQLRALWGEVLGLDQNSIYASDNFLQKNGDSVRAIALTSAARRTGKILSVSDIFRYPRLRDMAQYLIDEPAASDRDISPLYLVSQPLMMKEHAAKECNVQTEMIEDVYPCTPLQEGLMSVSSRTPNAYVATRVFDIPQSIDLDSFKQAWESSVKILPILRTRIALGPQTEALQVVLKEQITWGEINGSVKTYLTQSGLPRIDYGQPLSSYAISVRSRKFVWQLHHALYDGSSLAKLLSMVETLYHEKAVPTLPKFNTFIHYLNQVDSKESDSFWRARLTCDGTPASFPRLPSSDYHAQPNSEFLCSFTIPHHKAAGTLKTTILRAAWSLVTARYMESSNIVYGEVLAGRNVPVAGIEDMIGPCFTTVPIRIGIAHEQSVDEFLSRIQSDSAALIPFQHRGLQSLRHLGPEVHDSLGFNNLFEVHDSASRQSNHFLVEVQDKQQLKGFFDSYAVVMECILEERQTVQIEARYDSNVIDQWHMEKLCGHFRHVVDQLCTIDHEKSLCDIELISPEDMAAIQHWNKRHDMQCIESTIQEVFAEQVRIRPQALSISGWDGEMSYEELDTLSTQVAQTLSSRGVKREDIIPMCFEKSKWAVVAMLGIIKAGGAVAQLGVSHPRGRKQEILQDTGAAFVLVSKQQEGMFDGLIDVLVVDEMALREQLAPEESPLPQVQPSDAALQRGATICIPSEEERINDLAGAITKYNADWLFLTPTVAQLVSPTSVPTLRTLVLGGEAPTEHNIKTWSDHLRLMLIWGPAETTIYATGTSPTTTETSPTLLGSPMGCRLWLCEPDDHNRLAPAGCVGEIIVEGGLVSRGYLGNKKQTAASYFQDPAWAHKTGDKKSHRMYKTGDLARWGADGILRYVGRKDNQVKLYGQRIELEDVERRISRHSCVHHTVAQIPRIGPLKDKLIAVMDCRTTSSSHGPETNAPSSGVGALTPLSGLPLADLKNDNSDIRSDLEESLPNYECPSVWINVEMIPLNVNGKIDRKAVKEWLEEMDEDLADTLVGRSSDEGAAIPSTREEQTLETLVGRVLNIQKPNMKRSFLNLGGDSISAMQLRAQARIEGIDLTVQDIVKSKSLLALATTPKSSVATRTKHERAEANGLFDLSPIQKLFFDTAVSSTHLNQSLLLKINSTVSSDDLETAITALVSRHSMLRARFQLVDSAWRQCISDEVRNSFILRTEEIQSRDQVGEVLRQRNDFDMDISNGPLLVAYLFDVANGKEQLLLFSAHHLIVDLVSWRIILNDLQELLSTGTITSEPPLSFQDWLFLQQEHIETSNSDTVLAPVAPDLSYWGMGGQPNTFGDISTADFTLNETLTGKIFGSSNSALTTEPVDIILAALVHSFRCVFSDREAPPVFIEGHGRETWSNEVDPNTTVGWFTTISPLQITSVQSEIIPMIGATKDFRRKAKRQLPFFSSFSAPERDGENHHTKEFPVEILFNYMGKYQQLESENAYFSEVHLDDKAVAASQFHPKMERFSLIDIGVVVTHGQARFNVTYNKNMRNQDKIKNWTNIFKSSIGNAAQALECMNKQSTVSDFPLLPELDERKLGSLEKTLETGGISMENVRDIFPCAPLQQHMIHAQEQKRGSGLYEVSMSQQVLLRKASTVDSAINVELLQEAWKRVIDYHAILRTIFIPSSSRPGQHDQVVLSSYSADIPVTTCGNERDLLSHAQRHKSLDCHHGTTSDNRPHHRFTLFTSGNGRNVACKLEISHALIDGMSVSILFRDLASAYRGKLPTRQGFEPYFGDYVVWLAKQSTRESMDFWRRMINSSAHSFEKNWSIPQCREQKHLNINLDPDTISMIPSFCQMHGVTVATFFQAVWGLVLQQCLMRSEGPPLFGYMVANRDAAIPNAENVVGPMTAMVLCRAGCKPTTRIGDLLRRTQSEVLEAMQHQSALADAVQEVEIDHANGIDEQRKKLKLCTSVMSLQYMNGGVDMVPKSIGGLSRGKATKNKSLCAPSTKNNTSSNTKKHHTPVTKDEVKDIKFQLLGYHDPNEYDMSIGVQIVRNGGKVEENLDINVGFAYWPDAVCDAKARSIVRSFQRCVEEIVMNGNNRLRTWMVMRRLG